MRERPILFTGPMVRAILDGKKTQTRRVVKPQPPADPTGRWAFVVSSSEKKSVGTWNFSGISPEGRRHTERGREVQHLQLRCPYGNAGDRLWVRETCNLALDRSAVMYLEHGGKLSPDAPAGSDTWKREWKTCPSIHMPRWASRITLEITAVSVERLQEISAADAIAEGVEPAFIPPDREGDSHVEGFAQLWDELNHARGCGWHANPWVWVVAFRRIP